MTWQKMGLIFKPDHNYEWMATHAYVPVPDKISENVIRIYFATRSKDIKSVTTFIEVEADNPSNVLYVHDRPVLGRGNLGTFDDGGAVPFCMVQVGDKKLLYYGGWNASVTVPYRNAIGLAVSVDGGLTFQRVCEGAIVDRNQHEAYFTGACEVLREGGKWRMWYGSATGWKVVDGKPEPCYKIKYGESEDGINWHRPNQTCIEYKFDGEAIARPSIIRENGMYKMWYCSRGSVNYRTDPKQAYRVGYAESVDGLSWERKDEAVGIDRSAEGWDSIMMCYPYVFQHKEKKYLFYNGNGFGESGLGYAVME